MGWILLRNTIRTVADIPNSYVIASFATKEAAEQYRTLSLSSNTYSWCKYRPTVVESDIPVNMLMVDGKPVWLIPPQRLNGDACAVFDILAGY
jgi:hypothetical protein